MENNGQTAYLKLLTILIEFGTKVEQKHYVADVIADLIPKVSYQLNLEKAANFDSIQHKSIKSKPLPKMLTEKKNDRNIELVGSLLGFIAALYDVDRAQFLEFIQPIDLHTLLKQFTPNLALTPDTGRFLVSILHFCQNNKL